MTVSIMAKYNLVSEKHDGLQVITYKKNIFSKIQWGVINNKQEITLFSGNFEDVVILNRNLIARKVKIAKDKFKWELAKKSGERICPPKYDYCPEYIVRTWTSENIENYFYIAPVDGLYTLINGTGQQLCKPMYERIERDYVGNGFLRGLRGKYWHKINKKGIELKSWMPVGGTWWHEG